MAESYLVSILPGALEDDSFLARGSIIKFRLAPNSLATRKVHIFAAPAMSFWDRFANKLKRIKAHFKNGKDILVFQVSGDLVEQLEGGAKEVFPASSKLSFSSVML